jgi:hypothetical protein
MEEAAIGTLLDSYDQYNRLKVSVYYTVCFGTLPSSLRIALPMERSKESVEAILRELDFQRFNFTAVLKNWATEDFQNAERSGDYVFEYVFKSTEGHMIVHFSAREDMLTIDFFYDVNQPESEKWALDTNHALRKKFGSVQKPKFKVLVHHEGMFGTEDVNTGDFSAVDIHEMYNDDFAEINEIINASMARTESGIVLLHGDPGTGKTTYIKHLICKFMDKEFIFIQNDFVHDLLKPSFISFLLQNKNSVLIIEDAEKVVVSRDDVSEDSVVSTILQLTDGLFSDFLNIKILCTFNTDIKHIDKALLRKGRMIAKYNFAPLSEEKTAMLAKKLGHDSVSGSMTLADIFEFDKREFKNAVKKAVGFNIS